MKRAISKDIPYEVVVGLDWSKRIRAFDGLNSTILSDNVEEDNGVCEFATRKISYYGSGIAVSNAEFDPLEQEYRLNVSIGNASSQTTHAIVLNARTLAMYPYAKQYYQSMCVAESDNRQFLLALDRSGFVYILNTGNTDDGVVINEIFDSPFFYNKVPGAVSKGGKLDMFFKPTNAGDVYYQDRVDFASSYGSMARVLNIKTGSYTHIAKSVDIPSTYNIFQYRLMSSGSTTDPWVLTHSDLYEQGLGVGAGQ